jgi:hypothetical protein
MAARTTHRLQEPPWDAPTKGLAGHPPSSTRFILGAIGSFSEPFYGYSFSNVDTIEKGCHHEDDLRNFVFVLPTTRERIVIARMTSDRVLEASRQGLKKKSEF